MEVAVCGKLQWRSVPCAVGVCCIVWEETVPEMEVFLEVEKRLEWWRQ